MDDEASTALPSPVPVVPARLERLAERARDYAEAASSANTRRAYASDWKHFGAWCRRNGLEPLPPSPQTVGLYIAACASGAATADRKPNSVATIGCDAANRLPGRNIDANLQPTPDPRRATVRFLARTA